eukprot:4138294-Pyramimonas_sp.AAC.1
MLSCSDAVTMLSCSDAVTMLSCSDAGRSHVSTNETDGLNGLDFGQSQADNYFCEGDAGYHWLWDSRLYNYA